MKAIHFRAMGSSCRIVVEGGPAGLAHVAESMVARLEQMWSRFHPDSEVSQLNRNNGSITVVSPETLLLVTRARDATVLTDGAFNPLMLDQLCRLGYREAWRQPPNEGRVTVQPGCTEAITLFPEISAVLLPANSKFDPGGIGKGLAADLVTEMLIDRGASSSSVELGGDLRVSGSSWLSDDWEVQIEDPFDRALSVGAISPQGGAVATSSRLERRWLCEGREVHHLLDPSTGLPSTTDLVAVSACSSAAWWAEVVAKVTLMAGSQSAPQLLQRFGTPAVLVTEDRRSIPCPVSKPVAAKLEAVPA
ncbi:MAG: FAD:protein FMN transferase [Acidimicrobiales bacterium]